MEYVDSVADGEMAVHCENEVTGNHSDSEENTAAMDAASGSDILDVGEASWDNYDTQDSFQPEHCVQGVSQSGWTFENSSVSSELDWASFVFQVQQPSEMHLLLCLFWMQHLESIALAALQRRHEGEVEHGYSLCSVLAPEEWLSDCSRSYHEVDPLTLHRPGLVLGT